MSYETEHKFFFLSGEYCNIEIWVSNPYSREGWRIHPYRLLNDAVHVSEFLDGVVRYRFLEEKQLKKNNNT